MSERPHPPVPQCRRVLAGQVVYSVCRLQVVSIGGVCEWRVD
jgi:hypothetical protein